MSKFSVPLHSSFACSNYMIILRLISGSVYEISGSEVCFSTGDLIKVIGIELLSVCCEDTSNNEKFELPINHKGKTELSTKLAQEQHNRCCS